MDSIAQWFSIFYFQRATLQSDKTKLPTLQSNMTKFRPKSSEEQKTGYHARRCPNLRPKSSEEQKKSRTQMSKLRPTQVEDIRFMTYRKLLCSETSNYPPEILKFPTSG